eukprot:jgi/Botrbrau1/7661/Bobra.0159s0103.1
MCDAGGWRLAHLWFQDCNHKWRDNLGFACGMISIGFWLVAQLPQIITNFRTQSADALSPYFLAEWLMGDTSNLIGCLLTGTQLATQTYTAMYYVFMDVVLVMQYVFYTSIQRRHEKHYFARFRNSFRRLSRGSLGDMENGRGGSSGSISASPLRNSSPLRASQARVMAGIAVFLVVSCGTVPSSLGWGALSSHQTGGGSLEADSGRVFRRRLLRSSVWSLLSWLAEPRPSWAIVAGLVMGYVSMVLYLGSRISQIKKNWERKSTEGLAMAMFMAAIGANVAYGSSILIRTYSVKQLLDSLPWILGSLGTVALDLTILYQSRLYKRQQKEVRQPLLVGAGE